MPTDGQPLTNQAIAALLKPISDKTDKLMVLYDACHSGGIASSPMRTRSLVQDGQVFTPKMAPDLSPEQCSVPTNMRTRSLAGEAFKLGGLSENIVHISSSRPDEVSFDQPGRGGIATQAFRDCLLGEAKDLDGSGNLSIQEITACAQIKVNKALANAKDISAPTMVVSGNKGFVPALFKQDRPVLAQVAPTPAPTPVLVTTPAAAPVAPTPVPTTPVLAAQLPVIAPSPIPALNRVQTTPVATLPVPASAVPNPVPVITPAPNRVQTASLPPVLLPSAPTAPVAATVSAAPAIAAPAPPAPLATVMPMAPTEVVSDPASAFEDAMAQANGKIKVSVKANQTVYKIGKDDLLLDVTSNTAGFVNIVSLGSDRKTFYMLFPNALDANNAIKAGETLKLPRKSWGLVSQGPAGENDILVVVTESPRDLAALGGAKAGPFLANLTNADGRANLQWLLGTSQSFDTADCSQGGKTRGFAVVKKCSDSFGAARVTLREEK